MVAWHRFWIFGFLKDINDKWNIFNIFAWIVICGSLTGDILLVVSTDGTFHNDTLLPGIIIASIFFGLSIICASPVGAFICGNVQKEEEEKKDSCVALGLCICLVIFFLKLSRRNIQ